MRVSDYLARNNMKVVMSCYQFGKPVFDDTRQQWTRNTIIHNPFLGIDKDVMIDNEED